MSLHPNFINLFLCSILFLISFNIYSQTGKISYKIEAKEKSKEELKININNELELFEFELNYNKNLSYFKKRKTIYNNDRFGNIATVLIGATDDYFQNSTEKTSYFNKTIKNNLYQVDNSFKMNKWELTNESILINGYTCYKAIMNEYNTRTETSFKTIGWYTPEIPAGYGPIGYGGLPGLILQLEYKSFVYNVKEIKLNPKKVQLETLKNNPKITIEEMVILMRKARKVTKD